MLLHAVLVVVFGLRWSYFSLYIIKNCEIIWWYQLFLRNLRFIKCEVHI